MESYGTMTVNEVHTLHREFPTNDAKIHSEKYKASIIHYWDTYMQHIYSLDILHDLYYVI